jgi:undecaprenyl-diphosphatase
MDWHVFHFLNGALQGHRSIADQIEDFVSYWAVPLFAAVTFSLWLLDRPGGRYRWRVVCLAALTSAAIGLLLSQAVSHLWARERPFVAHPRDTILLVAPSHEPSFPSDHAVAAFAIAFTVALMGGRLAGVLFLAGASLVAVPRIFVGLHYPGDIAGGVLIGLISALAVYFVTRGRWSPLVRLLSRLTDPVTAPAWRALDVQRARRRVRHYRLP